MSYNGQAWADPHSGCKCPGRNNRSKQGFLRSNNRIGTTLFVPGPISPSKFQGHPKFKRKRKRLHLLMGGAIRSH